MKRIIFFLLAPTFGSKKFKRVYEVLKNISFVGLNYRDTKIKSSGEFFFMKAIKNFLSKSADKVIIFDVGANIGNYSRHLSSVFTGPDKMIYAFEPYSKAFSELKKLENEITGFHSFNVGFSDKKETASFLSNNEFSEVGSLYNKDFSKYNFSLDVSEQVNFDTIENFCSEHGIGHIHFLKIDVEGHELFVLKGAQSMLAENKIDFIQFEFGSANYLSKTYLYDFFQLLLPRYRMYRLLRNGLTEISEYNTDFELHILCNYIAINRGLSFETK